MILLILSGKHLISSAGEVGETSGSHVIVGLSPMIGHVSVIIEGERAKHLELSLRKMYLSGWSHELS